MNPHLRRILTALLVALALRAAPAAFGQDQTWRDGVAFDQELNAQLPLDVTFQNQDGQTVQLGDYFSDKPVILMPVYYKCPMLCGLELNGMVRCLRGMEMSPGTDFEIVTFSISPRETPQLARQKRASYLLELNREGAEDGWQFLTGSQDSIDQVCDAIGFKAQYNEQTEQYAHAAGIVICTPEGRVARYLYGVDFAPRDMRLSLLEASENKVGSLSDQILLYCYHYDPTRGKYGLAIMNLIRAGGALTVLVLAGGIAIMLRRERKRNEQALLEGGSRG